MQSSSWEEKVENLCSSNKSKEAQNRLKVLCISKPKNIAVEPDHFQNYVNNLNKFSTRFDVCNFETECENLIEIAKHRNNERIVITREDVIKSILHIKVGKSCGPDNISAHCSCWSFC